jgi:hypothetical protein
VSGRFLNMPRLWIAGAHATSLGVSLGVAVACLALIEGVRRGQLLWLCGLAAFALARVLRGSPGVPPDTPLLVLSAIGSVLVVAADMHKRTPRPQAHG